jgi:hypothetical protein
LKPPKLFLAENKVSAASKGVAAFGNQRNLPLCRFAVTPQVYALCKFRMPLLTLAVFSTN